MRVLVLSPRVAPGLLSREAWRLLDAAPQVYVREVDRAHARAFAAAGIGVETDPGPVWYEPDSLWVTTDPLWARQAIERLRDEAPEADIALVPGSFDVTGARVIDLIDVMDRLRDECPWTARQTHASLAHYAIEEAHEVVEAIESADSAALREELGDLLMQVVFHARIASEGENWTVDDVARDIADKLIYRNPHVFGDADVVSAEEVDANWQALKATEKKRESPWDGIPNTLPSLAAAAKILDRLHNPSIDGSTLGERFLALVVEANEAGLDPEGIVRRSLRNLAEPPTP